MRFLLCVVLVCSFIACSKGIDKDKLPVPSSYSVAETNGFSGVVLIQSGGDICTGVFMSPTTVITAAHCLKRTSQVIVEAGSQRMSGTVVAQVGDGSSEDTFDMAFIRVQNAPQNQEYYSIGKRISAGDTVYMVGYGCNENIRNTGGGVKRSGTNMVYKISDYIEVLSPVSAPKSHRSLLGPSNRAGSCFGDSGGPMFVYENGQYVLVGIDHAVVAEDATNQVSVYIDFTRNRVRNYLDQYNQQYSLGMAFAR